MVASNAAHHSCSSIRFTTAIAPVQAPSVLTPSVLTHPVLAISRTKAAPTSTVCAATSHFESNRTFTAASSCNFRPTGVKSPVSWSIDSATTLPVFWFPSTNHLPSFVIPNPRGISPPLGVFPRDRNVLDAESTAKVAIELWPRFDTYKNLPDG